MEFSYTAMICGGRGPDTWDRETTVSGPDLTISQALILIEGQLEGDEAVVRIEQDD